VTIKIGLAAAAWVGNTKANRQTAERHARIPHRFMAYRPSTCVAKFARGGSARRASISFVSSGNSPRVPRKSLLRLATLQDFAMDVQAAAATHDLELGL